MTLALACLGLAWFVRLHKPPRGSVAAPTRVGRKWSLRSMARPLALLLGFSSAVVVHPVAGLMIGGVGWWLLPALMPALQTGVEAETAAAMKRQVPLVADLLASCLAAGATLGTALTVVGQAVDEPAGPILSAAAMADRLGAGPAEVVALLTTGDDDFDAIGAAVIRSSESGAPLAEVLTTTADRARQRWQSDAQVRARSVAVRSVLPLAVCFLPAFLLLGVVPIVAGYFSDFLSS